MAAEIAEETQLLSAVLLIEDDAVTLENYGELLVRSGIAHKSTRSGAEGLSLLDADPSIDVVVTDLMLPDIDGLGVLNALRSLLAGRPWIQAIVVTGRPSIETAIQALRLEAVDFLTKPIAPSDFIAAVQRARARAFSVRFRGLGSAHSAAHHAGTRTATKPDGSIDIEFVRSLVKARALRTKMFQSELFAEPAWDMLLDLLIAHLSGKKVYVTSLCIAAGVPIATAFRRIEDLAANGLISKTRDSKDTRRVFVQLTDAGYRKMADYLNAVSAQAPAA